MIWGFGNGKNKADLLEFAYPVGSIYMSVNSTNPSTLFGGTWEAWGSGKVPVGVDSSDTSFNAAEKTGGEKTHTLTVDEIPSHTHGALFPVQGDSIKQGSGAVVGEAISFESSTTGATGGGQAHNNLQPYITCYMWKRTA